MLLIQAARNLRRCEALKTPILTAGGCRFSNRKLPAFVPLSTTMAPPAAPELSAPVLIPNSAFINAMVIKGTTLVAGVASHPFAYDNGTTVAQVGAAFVFNVLPNGTLEEVAILQPPQAPAAVGLLLRFPTLARFWLWAVSTPMTILATSTFMSS